MTPEEALRNILTLVDGSDEIEDVRAMQLLLQSIKTLAEKGLAGRNNSWSIIYRGDNGVFASTQRYPSWLPTFNSISTLLRRLENGLQSKMSVLAPPMVAALT